MNQKRLTLLATIGALAVANGVAAAAADSPPSVRFRPTTINLFRRTSVAVTGLPARSVEMRLKGATDETGLAYRWTPYRWRRLRLANGVWTGALPAPALFGVYELQLRVDGRRKVVQSPNWLLRVFPPQTLTRPTFPRPEMVVRDFIDRLPGDQVTVALRRVQPAAFDHRDTRLNRIFAVAYAPCGNTRPSSRLGLFITTVRAGVHSLRRLLDATVEPYG
jgi:hypothetical protein